MNSDFLNFSSKFPYLLKNFSFIKSFKKKFEKRYSNEAPTDKPTTTRNVPIHLPNINPPKIAIGDPKPAAKTQIIVKRINITAMKYKFVCFKSEK